MTDNESWLTFPASVDLYVWPVEPMDTDLTKAEFEALPFRDDVTGDYIVGQSYRARAYSNIVFVFRGSRARPNWDAYQVRVKE